MSTRHSNRSRDSALKGNRSEHQDRSTGWTQWTLEKGSWCRYRLDSRGNCISEWYSGEVNDGTTTITPNNSENAPSVSHTEQPTYNLNAESFLLSSQEVYEEPAAAERGRPDRQEDGTSKSPRDVSVDPDKDVKPKPKPPPMPIETPSSTPLAPDSYYTFDQGQSDQTDGAEKHTQDGNQRYGDALSALGEEPIRVTVKVLKTKVSAMPGSSSSNFISAALADRLNLKRKSTKVRYNGNSSSKPWKGRESISTEIEYQNKRQVAVFNILPKDCQLEMPIILGTDAIRVFQLEERPSSSMSSLYASGASLTSGSPTSRMSSNISEASDYSSAVPAPQTTFALPLRNIDYVSAPLIPPPVPRSNQTPTSIPTSTNIPTYGGYSTASISGPQRGYSLFADNTTTNNAAGRQPSPSRYTSTSPLTANYYSTTPATQTPQYSYSAAPLSIYNQSSTSANSDEVYKYSITEADNQEFY